MLLPIHITQATAARQIIALTAVTADIAITVRLMSEYLSASTEAAKAAQPVPINPPTPPIRVRAAQATAALTQATADIAGTALLTSAYPRVSTETGKTAQPVQMLQLMPHIQVTAAQVTAALTRA